MSIKKRVCPRNNIPGQTSEVSETSEVFSGILHMATKAADTFKSSEFRLHQEFIWNLRFGRTSEVSETSEVFSDRLFSWQSLSNAF